MSNNAHNDFRGRTAEESLELIRQQVVQPDIFYFGGMVRSMRVARMAAALGMTCTPHISGPGLGVEIDPGFNP